MLLPSSTAALTLLLLLPRTWEDCIFKYAGAYDVQTVTAGVSNDHSTRKELDWDPKAGTLSCKQTVSYVCNYYVQRFALGSGVWKMEPKVEGQYCTRLFKDHEHLAASCYSPFEFIILNNVVIVDYWNLKMIKITIKISFYFNCLSFCIFEISRKRFYSKSYIDSSM